MRPSPTRFDEKYWYQPRLNWLTFILLPASWLFGVITSLRRWCYRRGILKSHHFNIPVLVVGNITAGGTGKTPCVIALANYLIAEGWCPGIVSRGVGGSRRSKPVIVTTHSSPELCGDEALLLARRCECPVVIAANRVEAVRALLHHAPQCNVIISDDGLQHYRLARNVEIVIIDGDRQFGNGFLQPAGPLRESVSRLASVDFTLVNGGVMDHAYTMTLVPHYWVSVRDKNLRLDLDALPQQQVHGVAGIGNPLRFFNLLRKLGFSVIEHAFPDHYPFSDIDFNFGDDLPVLMTEKDAVKCAAFSNDKMWYLDVSARLDPVLLGLINQKLQGANNASHTFNKPA